MPAAGACSPAVRDLFGQVPVTMDDVIAWCECVAGIPADSPRLELYVRTYDVPGKVARAKLAGTFEELTTPAPIAAPGRLLAALAVRQYSGPNRPRPASRLRPSTIGCASGQASQ